jgi:hypothetical protein
MPVASVFKVADIVSANLIDALRFAAFLARLAEHHSAEGTAPRSPSRRDEAIAPRGRLVPDKRRLLLLVRQPGQSQHPSKASLYEAFPVSKRPGAFPFSQAREIGFRR